LNTTRAHPNALANALCWPVSGYNLKEYRSCMTITIDIWVMGEMQKIRTGRHCTFVMHVHLVFVTKFRHRVFTDAHLRRMEEVMQSVCTDFDCELVEFNGENNHVHLLVNFPPKITVTKLVNSLKGVSSRRLRLGGTSRPKAGGEFPDLVRHYWRANKLWSGSYFAGTVGGASLTVVRQYIEQQNRPV
jgi:putative transposase